MILKIGSTLEKGEHMTIFLKNEYFMQVTR